MRPFVRRTARLATLVASLPVLLAAAACADAQQSVSTVFEDAFYAWEDGDYVEALEGLAAALSAGPDAATLRSIALLTGEVFTTYELAPHGGSPRWSPDGRRIAFEIDDGARTRVIRADEIAVGSHPPAPNPRGVAPFAATLVWRFDGGETIEGGGLAFGPRGGEAYLGAAGAEIRLRGADDRERTIDRVGFAPVELFFAADGTLFAIGTPEGEDAPEVYRLGAGPPVRVTRATEAVTGARPLDDGRILLTLGGGSFRGPPPTIGLLDPAAGSIRALGGTTAAAATDGSIVTLAPDETGAAIALLRAGAADPEVLFRTDRPLANPTISPDGTRVAFQMMPREDWEIYFVDSPAPGRNGGSGTVAETAGIDDLATPVRVTTEIQHDLFPELIDRDRLFAVMGEGRHRRSYLYDLTATDGYGPPASALVAAAGAQVPGRTRLFHNNTVRTVSPEYEWSLSPDGSRMLVVAERDGDTVSPERAVYLVDLTRPVGAAELADRVTANLEHERRLRAEGARVFAPIREAVADAVASVSTSRIYGYASDVYAFGSKFVTEPGNAKAIDYYAAQLRRMGYEVELQRLEVRGSPSANVIAKLPGTVHPDLIYVVSSHFDSVNRGPGADDDSSGATALLEVARVLAGRPQPATIHFAFFTGEEAGLFGSREYVRLAVANGDRIVGALNNDMVGYANDQRLDNTIRYSNEGIRDVQHAAALLFTRLITYDAKYYKSTDAHAYYDAYGDIVGGIGSYPILGNPHYHQTHDVLETVNQQLVAEVAKTTAAALMLLASSPSRLAGVRVEPADGREADVTWEPAVEDDVVGYVVAYGPEGDPLAETLRVSDSRARVPAGAGTVVSVKAVNRSGLESWDWARVRLDR